LREDETLTGGVRVSDKNSPESSDVTGIRVALHHRIGLTFVCVPDLEASPVANDEPVFT